MLDDTLFASNFQGVYYQVLLKLLEKYLKRSSSAQNDDAVQGKFADIIKEVSARYNVDAKLVQAVMKAESNFDPKAVSSAGALGLMQLMPETAASLGVTDALDPHQNIEGGVRLLSQLLSMYNGDVELAVAGYNAGPGAVEESGGVPPYRETQTYVERVSAYYDDSEHRWSA